MPLPTRTRVILLACSTMLAGAGHAHAQIHDIRTLEQRHVGYLLGDRIPRTILIDHDPAWTLQTASLPATGPQAYWLELRSVATRTRQRRGRATTRIDLHYQSFYAPIAVTTLELPALALRLVHGDQVATAPVPAWSFTTAPLREVRLVGSQDRGEDWLTPRPDRRPVPLTTGPTRGRLLLGLALATLAALLLAWQHSVLPFRRSGAHPFAVAARAIRHLDGEQAYRQGFQHLHAAFNHSAGRVLLADDADAWLQTQPRFDKERDAIQRWFQASRVLFFGDGERAARAVFDEGALRQLARDLAAREHLA